MNKSQSSEQPVSLRGNPRNDPRRYNGPIELITTPIIWWSGLGFGAIIVLLAWSVKGKIPEISEGVGAFSYPFRVITVPINSPDQGSTIKTLRVIPGSFVSAGETIAEITQPTSYVQVLQAASSLELAKSKLKAARDSYTSLIKSSEQQTEAYQKLQRTGEELLKSGVISKTTYLQIAGGYNQQLGTTQSYRNNIISAEQSVASALIQYKTAREKYTSTAIIKSDNGGLVLNVNYRVGDPITSEPLLSLLDTSGYGKKGVPESLLGLLKTVRQDFKVFAEQNSYSTNGLNNGDSNARIPLYFIAYFDQANGGKVATGMGARILPNNIKANTVGTLRGIVKGVFPLPVGLNDSSAILGSTALSKSLLNNASNSYVQVVIGLVPNNKFKSGYEWVGGEGPESTVLIPKVGDTASVNIITEEKPPITVALPSLRNAFGLPMGM